MPNLALLYRSPIRLWARMGIFLGLLILSFGCGTKTVIQSVPTAPPPRQDKASSSVSEILLAQYQVWKGVPHRLGGSDRKGVDCSGLMQAVFRDAFQLNLPRTSLEQSRLGRGVDAGEMRPGDLLYFLDKGSDHVGVLVTGRQFLHASARAGVILSDFDSYWAPRLLRVRRILDAGT